MEVIDGFTVLLRGAILPIMNEVLRATGACTLTSNDIDMTDCDLAAAAVAARVLVGAFFLRPGVLRSSMTGL